MLPKITRDRRVPLFLILLVMLAAGFLMRGGTPTPGGGWREHTARTLALPGAWLGGLFTSGAAGSAEQGGADAPPEALAEMRAEVMALRVERETLRHELAAWRTGEATSRPGTTLDVNDRFLFLAADVVARQPQPRRQSITINRGSRHGVRPNLPVVSDAGLIGITREVDERSTMVQLLTDAHFAVAAEETGGRWQAVVLGQGAGRNPVVEPEVPVLNLVAGTAIKTSGLSGSLFPPGLLLGTLEHGGTNRLGLEPITLQPAADLDSRFVLVLLEW